MKGLVLVPVLVLVFLELFAGAGVFSGAVFLFFSVLVFYSVWCFSKIQKHRTPDPQWIQDFIFHTKFVQNSKFHLISYKLSGL
jgi:fatty acid desaturase